MASADRPVRLSDLAEILGRQLEGDDGRSSIHGVAALDRAGPGEIAFVRSPRHAAALARSRAGAVILPEGMDPGPRAAIRSPDPAYDFARVASWFAAVPPPAPGVVTGAQIDASAKLDASVHVGAGALVAAGVVVGARSVLHAGAILGEGVHVGADCVIHSGVVLCAGTVLGDRVVIAPGAVLGGEGFGFVGDAGAGERIRMPHLGRVVVEDDVEIGANTTIDRGTLGDTRIRRGAKIDNLVQIAHNCDVGEHAIIAAQSGLSGSTRVGAGAVVMAQAGSAGHLEIGDGAFVGARSGLHKDVPPGARVYGAPPLEERAWHRAVTALARLPELLGRVRAIERRLGLRPPRPEETDPGVVAPPASDVDESTR